MEIMFNAVNRDSKELTYLIRRRQKRDHSNVDRQF